MDRVILTSSIFDDDQQADCWEIGKVLRHDRWLVVVDFSGRHLAVASSRLMWLNGACSSALRKIVQARQEFKKAIRRDPKQLRLPGVENLLRLAITEFDRGAYSSAGRQELEIAIEHVQLYRSDPIKYRTSVEFFEHHTSEAIRFLLQ